MNQSFESSRAAEPVGAFPHAKRVGQFLFLSGIGPRVRGSKEIPGVTLDANKEIVGYDIEKQCNADCEKGRRVLEDAGATWNDSGAGGELRAGNIQNRTARSNIAGWAPQNNFLVVEIDGKTMYITPLGFEEVVVKNANGGAIPMPLNVALP